MAMRKEVREYATSTGLEKHKVHLGVIDSASGLHSRGDEAFQGVLKYCQEGVCSIDRVDAFGIGQQKHSSATESLDGFTTRGSPNGNARQENVVHLAYSLTSLTLKIGCPLGKRAWPLCRES